MSSFPGPADGESPDGAAAAPAAPARAGLHPDAGEHAALGAALAGAVAGRYTVDRLLGAGGMGSVFLGHDEALHRPVALKVVAPELARTVAIRERFLREARTVARLRHPGIVAVYAAGQADGVLWFAMEYVDGQSLRERLAHAGRLGWREVAALVRDLARALDYAHAEGVVHRDVKPENVLLDRASGRPLLTDFGIARALAAAEEGANGGAGPGANTTRTGMVLGSPRYMSPEQASGERTLDGRSDVYALGLLAWECLAGAPAVGGQTAAVILVKHLTETPAPVVAVAPDVPPVLAVAVDAALRKTPAERPTAAELAAACDAALAGVTHPAPAATDTMAWHAPSASATATATTSAPVAAAAGPAPRARRSLWGARVGAIAAALALLLGWWATTRGGRAEAPAGGDGRSYLVVPFEVQSADARLGWLRDASASLLTLDLGQWTDLTVVEYERTLDLLREAHLDGERRLGLEDARRVGHRAGVGTVVMGEVTGTTDSLIVVARLYDVATGRRLEQAQRSGGRADDPRPVFAALARDLLDLAGAPTTVGAGGGAVRITSSLSAYRDYLEGVRALNAWRLERADSLFGAAVEADSTFALAYYRRALANGFQSKGDAALAARNARALDMAVRHASRLAPRERDLIAAYRELDRGLGAPGTGSMGAPERLAEAERRYAALAARDSTSADAWYGLADARYHMAGHTRDWRVVQRLWNGSLRAFERTIGLDSSFHLAYQHRLDLYTLAAVPGSPMILDGDSLRLLDPTERRAFGEARFQGAKTRAQQLVVRDARAWVASDSAATKAYEALARAFVAAGQPDSAVHVLEAGLASAEARRPVLAYHMAFARAASGDHPGALGELRRALARFPADSLRGTMSPDAFWSVLGGAGVAAAAGAPDDVRRVVVMAAEALPQMPVPGGGTMPTQQLARWFEAGLQLAMGLPSEAPARIVARGLPQLEAVPGEGGRKARVMSVGVPYAAYLATGDDRFRATAVAWADTSAFTPLTELEALAAVQRGDTARARTLAAGFPPGAGGFALGGMRQVARAQVWLRLGDVRRAAETLEATDERRVVSREFVDVGRPTFVRSHLLRGQLWERLGDRPRAEAAYQRFLASWRDADAVLDGQRRLAREGLARLRDTRGTRAVPVS